MVIWTTSVRFETTTLAGRRASGLIATVAQELRSRRVEFESTGASLGWAFYPDGRHRRVPRLWLSTCQDQEATLLDAIIYSHCKVGVSGKADKVLKERARRYGAMLAEWLECDAFGDGVGWITSDEYIHRSDKVEQWIGRPIFPGFCYVISPDTHKPILPPRHGRAEWTAAIGLPGLTFVVFQQFATTMYEVAVLATADPLLPHSLAAALHSIKRKLWEALNLKGDARVVVIPVKHRSAIEFVMDQARIRDRLQLRHLITCEDCNHEWIISPDREVAAKKMKRLQELAGATSSAATLSPLSPFAVGARLMASRSALSDACPRCQGDYLVRQPVVLCPGCKSLVRDLVLRTCSHPGCGFAFASLNDAKVAWDPLGSTDS